MRKCLRSGIAIVAFGCAGAGAALADVPKVVVDIAPLHGLVARVMDGVAEPQLLLKPGASPHDYALRPSEAAALQEAEIVFHVGEGLTPWLDEAVDTLASEGQVFEMMALEGTTQLPFRPYAILSDEHGDHDHDKKDHGGHDEGKHDHEQHGHEDHAGHDEHGHDDHAGHEDHKDHGHDDHAEDGHSEHGDHGGHDHAHGDVDPHGWLDPQNAAFWMTVIADTLAEADPDNAATYTENATLGIKEIKAAVATSEERLFPHRNARFIVFHDAYQYFETAFGLEITAAIALGDASAPGARRVAAIRDLIAEEGITCIFSEPQFSEKLIETVSEGSDVSTAVIDPLGSEISPGPQFYPILITTMAETMADCFDASS